MVNIMFGSGFIGKGQVSFDFKTGAPVVEKKLTYKSREAMADSSFVYPKERKYPIHDISHARNALSRVAQHGTAAEKKRVKAAVYKKYPSLRKRHG